MSRVYYGWVITMVCFSALLAIYAINFSFGVFYEPIIRDFNSSRSTISLAFSIQTIFLYISAAIAGNIVGKFSLRQLVILGTVLLAFGMLGTSQSSSVLELFFFYGIVAGSGMGLIYIVGITTPSIWFNRRRGTATAIATSGIGVAVFISAPATSWLIELFDWKVAYFILTLTVLCLLGFVILLIADDPWKLDANMAHEFPDGQPKQNQTTVHLTEHLWHTASTTRPGSYLLILLAWIAIFTPAFTIYVHLVTYATDIGLEQWVGVFALSIVGGMTIPGRLISGIIADHLGRTWYFAVLTVMMAGMVVVLPFLREPHFLFGFATVYGFLYGGMATLAPALIADFYGTQNVTSLYGISSLMFGIAALSGPYLAAKTFEIIGTYAPFFIVSGVICLAGSGCIVLAGYWADI